VLLLLTFYSNDSIVRTMRMKLYSPGIVLVSLSILTREICAGFHAQNNERLVKGQM